ncbi:MAG: CoA transferase, partial [Candidatus Limnocylindria bacterium]|nr:CoA transferase [Candidatus Limnocylindria bacterium]
PHHYWHAGEEPERVGMRHHYIVPYGPYLAKDGKFVNVVVASPADWEVFCREVVRRPDLLAEPDFKDTPARRAHRGTLERIIEDLFLTEDSEEWFARLAKADLAYGRLRGIGEVLAHPQVAARKLIRDIDSEVGRLPTIESALRLSAGPVATGPLPTLGADTEAVLREAGYTDRELEGLRVEKAI